MYKIGALPAELRSGIIKAPDFRQMLYVINEILEVCILEKAADAMPAAFCFINSCYYFNILCSIKQYHFSEFRNFLTLFHVF